MNPLISSLAVVLTSFSALWVFHALWFRLGDPPHRPKALMQTLLGFLPIVGVILFVIAPKMEWSFASSLQTLSFAGLTILISLFLSLMFYMGVDHSVRVRIFVELSRHQGHPLNVDRLFEIYLQGDPTSARVDQLIRGGYLVENSDGSYKLTAKGLQFARFAQFGKNFFRTGLGG